MIDHMNKPLVFSHIDTAFDNFLIMPSGDIKLIDWEYAGMCDPLIDIAMFALYADFDEKSLLKITEYYFNGSHSSEAFFRINAYMSLGGFIWYLWARFKQSKGTNFNCYQSKMYAYACEFYGISIKLIKKYTSY